MLTNDDIITLTAKKLNVPRELVHVVMLDFWHNLRTALIHPNLVFRQGIRIKNCIKIKFNPTVILRDLVTCVHKYPCSENYFKLLTVNNYLINNEIYSEKQSKVAYKHKRLEYDIEGIKRDCYNQRQARRRFRNSDFTEEE